MLRRNLPARITAGLLILFLGGFCFSCSDDPASVDDPTPPTGTGLIDPQGDQDVLLSTVTLGDPYRGGIEVWARNVFVPSDTIVTFDLVLVNKTNLDIFPPLHFVITEIRPNAVTVLNPDGYTPDRHPFFDFSGKLGEDGRLTPNERSGQAELRFGMPELTAFSIGFRIVVGEPAGKGAIGGVVFRDLNEDGEWDSEREPGIPEFPVELRSAAGDRERTMIVRTDRAGHYRFEELGVGVYQVTALAPLGAKCTTENPLLVTLVKLPDGTITRFERAHFGISILLPPIDRIFGPVDVGPASANGTEIDTTFVVFDRDPPLPKLYYLTIEPPLTFRYVPMWLEEAEVWLNDELIFKFDCPTDSLCPPPSVRTLIEPGIEINGENRFRARVTGNEDLMLFMSIEREIQ